MHRLEKFEQSLLALFRMDLQLHFFWGFTLTIMAVFWPPLIISGFVVTILKEGLDVLAQKGWSWGDVNWGTAGSTAGLGFLYAIGFF